MIESPLGSAAFLTHLVIIAAAIRIPNRAARSREGWRI
jgi:hypothetical protein